MDVWKIDIFKCSSCKLCRVRTQNIRFIFTAIIMLDFTETDYRCRFNPLLSYVMAKRVSLNCGARSFCFAIMKGR
jgi:hypothetical protein